MKKNIALLLLIISIKSNGQLSIPTILTISGSTQIRSEKIIYGGVYNQEVDDNVVWALNKYWSFSIQEGALDKNAEPFKANKNISLVSVDDFRHFGDQGAFFNSMLVVSNMLERKFNEGIVDKVFSLPFDNFIKKKEPEVVIGCDKTMHLMANKALTYTMLFCSMVKNFVTDKDAGYFAGEQSFLKKRNELAAKHRGTTVLIPTEILDNGISKEAFAGLKYKYEFDSSDNIAKRIKEGKNVASYSQLLLIKNDTWTDYLIIVDLEKGDLVNWAGFSGSMINKTYKYMDDKRVAKLIQELY